MACQERTTFTECLSDETTSQVLRLSKVNPLKSIAAISVTWAVIFLATFLSEKWFSFPLYVLSVIIIATRQHALYVLMHEGTHYRLFQNIKFNDLFCNLFVSFPIFFRLDIYRNRHLRHHRFVNTEEDPDWSEQNKSSEWQFPMEKKEFFNQYKKYLHGHTLIDIWNTWRVFLGLKKQKGIKSSPETVALQCIYYSFCVLFLLLSEAWLLFFMYWIVPAATLFPLIMRVRNVAEHFGVDGDHELNLSRNIECPWWEKLLIAPFNVSFHLDHHLFPSIPFYNLSKLHEVLKNEEMYSELSHTNNSYFGKDEKSLSRDLLV